MKYGQPLPLKANYFAGIEAEINRLFFEVIYRALAKILEVPKSELANASDTFLDAIRTGKIWYQDSQFFGDFNATISRELKAAGAHWNRDAGTWGLAPDKIPTDWRFSMARAVNHYDTLRDQLTSALDKVDLENIDRTSSIPDVYIRTIDRMEHDLKLSVRAAYEGIAPQLTAAQRGIIAAEWGQNLDLYIRDWTSKNIIDLREKIQQSALSGRRSSTLVDIISQNYGVSKSKAKFLARQETSLLLSKFREVRYRDLGVETYRWSTSNDARVREDHKHLHGKTCQFANPPVVDTQNGRRANPGEDFGCRCVAIPVFV
jgi:SPP1 gp7 family putative phage head morphogenesis protein